MILTFLMHLTTPLEMIVALFTPGIDMRLGWSARKQISLTHMCECIQWDQIPQTTFRLRQLYSFGGGLVRIWPRSFSRVSANVFWATWRTACSADVLEYQLLASTRSAEGPSALLANGQFNVCPVRSSFKQYLETHTNTKMALLFLSWVTLCDANS